MKNKWAILAAIAGALTWISAAAAITFGVIGTATEKKG